MESSLADMTKWLSRCWHKPYEIVVSLPAPTKIPMTLSLLRETGFTIVVVAIRFIIPFKAL